MKIEIDIPDRYEEFFDYIQKYFKISKEKYLRNIIRGEIESRNQDLHIF